MKKSGASKTSGNEQAGDEIERFPDLQPALCEASE